MIKCIAASLIASLISTIAFGQNLPDSHYGPGPTLSGSSPVFTGLTLSGLTQGSVLFAGAGGVLSQDNANFFYSGTRLGLGTSTLGNKLTTTGSISLGGGSFLGFTASTTLTSANYALNGDTTNTQINSPSGFINFNIANVTKMFLSNGGNLGIGNTVPQALLSIGTTAATARSYNSFTDASNGEWAYMGDWGFGSNIATYGTDKNGTGTTRPIQFTVGGTVTFSSSIATTTFNNAIISRTSGAGDNLFIANAAGANKWEYYLSSNTLILQDLVGGSIFSILSTGGLSLNGPLLSPTATHTAAAPTVAAGQIGFGGTVAATGNCGTLSGDAGCIVVNVAGTTRYIPYY